MGDYPIEILHAASNIIIRDFDLDPERMVPDTDSRGPFPIDLKKLLIQEISYLLDHNFEKLKWVLYRIDVNENKLKQTLANKSPDKTASIMAEMIIERQIEKAITRKKYTPENNSELEDV